MEDSNNLHEYNIYKDIALPAMRSKDSTEQKIGKMYNGNDDDQTALLVKSESTIE